MKNKNEKAFRFFHYSTTPLLLKPLEIAGFAHPRRTGSKPRPTDHGSF